MKYKFRMALCCFPVILLALIAIAGEAAESYINKLFKWIES